jgi:hypothetical protein
VAKLVDQSPLSTPDGSLLLGSQHTSVFLLDGRTGQLLRTLYDFDGELGQLDAAALGEATAPTPPSGGSVCAALAARPSQGPAPELASMPLALRPCPCLPRRHLRRLQSWTGSSTWAASLRSDARTMY